MKNQIQTMRYVTLVFHRIDRPIKVEALHTEREVDRIFSC
jgi:hypothetical protein